jgi:hypothetical protein
LLFAEPPHFAGALPYLAIYAVNMLPGGFQRSFVGWRDDVFARNHEVIFIDQTGAVI